MSFPNLHRRILATAAFIALILSLPVAVVLALTISPIPPRTNPVSTSWVDVSYDTDAPTASDRLQYGETFTRNWAAKNIGAAVDINDVYADNSQSVFAVTQNGSLYVSTNGGTSWTDEFITGSYVLTSVTVGPSGKLYLGTDAGIIYEWDGSLSSGTCGVPAMGSVRDLAFDGSKIWAVGDTRSIFRYDPTLAGCPHSEFTNTNLGVDVNATHYTSITAVDANHIYATSNDVAISWTTNGGSTPWTTVKLGTDGDNCLAAVHTSNCIFFEDIKAANANAVYAASRNNGIFKFDGVSWKKLPPPFSKITGTKVPDFQSIGIGDANHALILGCCSTSGHDYYSAINDGQMPSGVVELPGALLNTNAIATWFTSPTVGWVVGVSGRVSKYSVSYSRNDAWPVSSGGSPHTTSVAGLQQSVSYHGNAKSATAVGPGASEAETGDFLFTPAGLSILAPGINEVTTSTDATLSWTTSLDADARAYAGTAVGWQSTSIDLANIQDIAVIGDQAYTAGTSPNEIRKNSALDVTQPWTTSYSNAGPSSFVQSVSFSGSNVWAAGNGFVLRYDGGAWTSAVPGGVFYNSVFALDDQHVWAGGQNKLIRTSNGGTSWDSFDLIENFRDVFAVDANLVLAVGDNTHIYRSTDGGVTWGLADTSGLTPSAFRKIFMLNAQEGWAVGNNALAARTTDGGKTWTKICIDPAYSFNQEISAVAAMSQSDVLIVGETGTVQRWTGSGCFRQLTGPDAVPGVTAASTLTSAAADTTNIWIAGAGGFLARRGLDTSHADFRSQSNAAMVQPHSLAFNALRPNTTYNYFVQSTDANGFSVVSGMDTFLTLPAPTLEVAPTALNFEAVEGGPNPALQSFAIRDQFGVNVPGQPWTVTKTAGVSWLAFLPSSGNGIPNTVNVIPDVTGLAAAGLPYTGTLTVDAPGMVGTPKTVTVNLTITKPILHLDTNTVNFSVQQGDPIPGVKPVNITNSGTGSLNFTMAKLGGAAWLDISTGSGTSPYPTPNQIRVRPNTTATAGTFTETIRVTGVSSGPVQNSPQDIVVTYIVQGPDLRLTPGPNPSLTFNAVKSGPNPPAQNVTIENAGGGNLSWTASSAEPWLQFLPANGGNGPTTLQVRPQTGTLAAGNHNGTITINAGTALNSPQTISVLFKIADELVVNPAALSFSLTQGTNTDDKTFVVVSGDPAGWSAVDPVPASGPDWISLPGITSGSSYPSPAITVHVDTTGLAVGRYNESVVVNSPGASPPTVSVDVTLDVTAPPQLAVNPTTVNLSTTEGGPSPTGSFNIANIGVGTLNWSINQPAEAWVKITDGLCGGPYGPLNGAAPSTITVCTDVTGLTAVGSPYLSNVTVNAPGAVPPSQLVNIILTITPDTTPPTIDPNSVQVVPFSDCAIPDTGAEISWRTDEASDSEVWWGQNIDGSGVPQYEEGQIIVAPDPVDPTLHRVTLNATNLIVGGHLYYIKLRSTDLRGNPSAWIDHDPRNPTNYLTFIAPAACDPDPPENFTVTFPPNPVSGTIDVDLSAEDASGINRFELYIAGFPPFATFAPNPGACTLVGPSRYRCTARYSWNTTTLTDGTYAVFGTAFDAANNGTTSSGATVEIENTAPMVTNVNASPVRQGDGTWNATITWDTGKSSTSLVRYGLENPDGTFSGYTDQKAGDDDAGCNGSCTSHTVTLTRLLHARIYHYQVESCSPTNPALCGN